jgi:hypothetical protein
VPARSLILTAGLEAFCVCETCSQIFQLAGMAWRPEVWKSGTVDGAEVGEDSRIGSSIAGGLCRGSLN